MIHELLILTIVLKNRKILKVNFWFKVISWRYLRKFIPFLRLFNLSSLLLKLKRLFNFLLLKSKLLLITKILSLSKKNLIVSGFAVWSLKYQMASKTYFSLLFWANTLRVFPQSCLRRTLNLRTVRLTCLSDKYYLRVLTIPFYQWISS